MARPEKVRCVRGSEQKQKKRRNKMKVCFPVSKVGGMDSKVYGHFGSAPAFIVVDTANNSITTIKNGHDHGISCGY
jgi:hypothetical protein